MGCHLAVLCNAGPLRTQLIGPHARRGATSGRHHSACLPDLLLCEFSGLAGISVAA